MSTGAKAALSTRQTKIQAHPRGGRDLKPPPVVHRKVQIAQTNHPSTDRWIVLTTVRVTPSPLYRVSVVDGLNRPVEPHRDYPTLRRARNAANKLHKRLKEGSN